MKQINGIKIVVLTALMAGCNLFAAAGSNNEAHKKLCENYKCTFVAYNDHYGFIQAKRLPRHDWEKPDVPEKRHIDFMQNEFIPYCNGTSDVREISNFIQSHLERFPAAKPKPMITVTDQDHARIILNGSSDLFRESKICGRPIVVDETPLNINESSKLVELRQPDGDFVESITSKLAEIRTQKDSDFYSTLLHISLVRVLQKSKGISDSSFKNIRFREACIALFDQGYVRPSPLPQVKLSIQTDEAIESDEDDQSVDVDIDDADSREVIHEQRIPSPKLHGSRRWWWGGFFAGLGFSGSIGCAAYFLRAYQDGIRIASGCASVAAGMAFVFAQYKLAQEGNNHKFWRGARDGAVVSAALGGGLFLAHDSPAVQKLVALAARTK